MNMMQHQSLLEIYLRQLRLPTFAHNYAAFAQDAARTGLSCERYLCALSEAEISQRDANRVERSIAQAKLPVLKELSQFDWSCVQGVEAYSAISHWKHIVQGGYITQAEPILMIGNPDSESRTWRQDWRLPPADKASGCASTMWQAWSMISSLLSRS